MFKFGDRVEISGRTMLRPGFSLVGLAGMVFPTAPNAPAGTVSVAIDWLAFDYSEANGYPEGSLPPVVNVPADHLILLDENPTTLGIAKPVLKPNPNAPAKPKLGIVSGGADASKTGASNETPGTDVPETAGEDDPAPLRPDEDDEPPRPRLRLV